MFESLKGTLNDLFTSDSPKKRVKKYLLVVGIMIMILLILAVNAKKGSDDCIEFSYSENAEAMITLAGPQNMTLDIPVNEISDMLMISRIEFGIQTDGIETEGCYCGSFQSKSMGEYILYAQKNVVDYIVIQTDTRKIVFNLNSSSETKALYQTMVDMGIA